MLTRGNNHNNSEVAQRIFEHRLLGYSCTRLKIVEFYGKDMQQLFIKFIKTHSLDQKTKQTISSVIIIICKPFFNIL